MPWPGKKRPYSTPGVLAFPLRTAQILPWHGFAFVNQCVQSVCVLACAHVCAPFCELHVGEEEEVSSEQWYSGKDCSVLVDVCVGGHCGVGGSLGLWLLREIRNYLVCFQFKCKFWKREHLNMCRDTKNRGKWIVRTATLRAPVYYLLLAIASNILRARCGGIITSAREWPQ